MMAALRHPNIVAFLGVCAEPPAVVTEYCRRGSLTGEPAQLLGWAVARPQRADKSRPAAPACLIVRRRWPTAGRAGVAEGCCRQRLSAGASLLMPALCCSAAMIDFTDLDVQMCCAAAR